MVRRRGGQWSAMIASLADHGREREGADERDRVVSRRAGAREKERVRLTGGVGRSAGEGWARAGARKMGRVGRAGDEWAHERERKGRGEGLGRIRPSRGGISFFLFLFLFLFT
jgi:hypothetical protein